MTYENHKAMARSNRFWHSSLQTRSFMPIDPCKIENFFIRIQQPGSSDPFGSAIKDCFLSGKRFILMDGFELFCRNLLSQKVSETFWPGSVFSEG